MTVRQPSIYYPPALLELDGMVSKVGEWIQFFDELYRITETRTAVETGDVTLPHIRITYVVLNNAALAAVLLDDNPVNGQEASITRGDAAVTIDGNGKSILTAAGLVSTLAIAALGTTYHLRYFDGIDAWVIS